MAGDQRPSTVRRLIPLGVLALGAALFFALGGHRYVSFAALAENREWLVETVAQAGVTGALAFIASYAVLVAISFPGAALLTISSGFLFGPWFGTGYAVGGATIGATIVFLAARAGLAGLAARIGPRADRIAAGFRDNGLNYLLVVRLIPLFPFWLVNLAAGLVGLRLSVFIVGTFIGIIPVTFILANLGNGLGALVAEGQPPDLTVLSSPGILLPLLGLAAFALLPVAFRRWRATSERETA
jgi:uncharacterized membrane protein YdjX (TVP38/TMEM64 family)